MPVMSQADSYMCQSRGLPPPLAIGPQVRDEAKNIDVLCGIVLNVDARIIASHSKLMLQGYIMFIIERDLSLARAGCNAQS